jgi:beta-lactam-binding protein with PASTA domain
MMPETLRKSIRVLGGIVLIGALGGLGIWVANSWLLPRHVGSGTTFSMPLLEGRSREEVYAACADHGLLLSERAAEYDASLPSGYLLRQDPRPGTRVKPGRRTIVVFSAGPRLFSVPGLRGRTERQTRLTLEDLGLIPGDVIRVAGEEPAGLVLSSRPGAGARIPVGGRVDLLLSKGPRGTDYIVPDLRRRDLEGVLALLEGSGLARPRIRYRTGSGERPGRVLDQVPVAGSRLERGRSFELVVASEGG